MDKWQGIPLAVVEAGYQYYRMIPGLSRVLQPFWFAETETDHIAYLLARADFPMGAKILDAGCGTGETARMMKEQRPDLTFTLLNFSALQLADATGDEKVCASAHEMPFEDNTFDGVMFNAALCNMRHELALREAERVTRPGGVLFLNELERMDGDNDILESMLYCHAYNTGEIGGCLEHCDMDMHETPDAKRLYLKEIWGDGRAYDAAFGGVKPGLWRFIKKGGTE